MFGIGLPELLLIMGLGLVVLGPDKLPDLAKQLAKGMVELKRTANSLKESLQEELEEENGSSPLVDEIRKNAGQPWQGLDGKGLEPSDTLPDGFEEFNNGIGVVGVNGPVAAPGAAAVDAEAGSEEQAAAGEVVAEVEAGPEAAPDVVSAAESEAAGTPEVAADNGSESVVAETPDQQEKTTA